MTGSTGDWTSLRGAEPAPRPAVEFLIDDDDRVIAVNREFVRFANENDWPISRTDVLGVTLWDAIDGRQVAALNRMLISSVRSGGRTVTLPMRCDSPTRRRLLEVGLTPRVGGQVAFSAAPQRLEPRPYQPLFVPAICNGPGEVVACSWCARFAPAGDWLEAEEAAELIGIPRGTPAPRLRYTVCGSCGDLLSAA